MSYLESNIAIQCTGCGACVNACCHNAISMVVSDDTFTYPVIDSAKCNKCGLCKKVCEQTQNIKLAYPLSCFAGVISNHNDFMKSASGGAFIAIVKTLYRAISMGAKSPFRHLYVCGAVFDGFKVVHDLRLIDDEALCSYFSKSKYIQSDIRFVYKEIKKLLSDSNNYVIFSGTPCQCAGLKAFLSVCSDRDLNNLLLVDVLCGGVPSQCMFNKYVDDYRGGLCRYEFREKTPLDNGTIYTRSAKLTFKDGRVKKLSRLEDSYLEMFHSLPVKRSSCSICRYSNKTRIGDITIGDAWGIEKLKSSVNPRQGYSLVMLNTEKGKNLEAEIKALMDCTDVDIVPFSEHNSGLKQKAGENIVSSVIKKNFTINILSPSKSFKDCVEMAMNALKKNIGYTTGTFDLFHVGHLNILKKAKEQCDFLVVGVSTDELVESYKGRAPIIPFIDRMKIVEAIKYVDAVVPQTSMDKYKAWEEIRFHKFFHGDDWKGSALYNEVETKLKAVGVEIIYFEYTKNVSSSMIRTSLKQ